MVIEGTPVTYHPDLGLWVKHEEECCPPGPHFSKTRGVYAHIAKRPEALIGVLDTSHSQGGWATAQACSRLGKRCVLYYPVRKADDWSVLKPQQLAAQQLGATLIALPAGRSAVLYHQARASLATHSSSYMMPNALKLLETVQETAAEFLRTTLPPVDTILVSASSGTIAAGLLRGIFQRRWRGRLVIHMGYSRPAGAVLSYMEKMAGVPAVDTVLIDEGYGYSDAARDGAVLPPFPSNQFYDLKAWVWWAEFGREQYGEALLWNIG